jgi:anaerobic magnesium-protoporphyrin IX monomethyl ester cyclase
MNGNASMESFVGQTLMLRRIPPRAGNAMKVLLIQPPVRDFYETSMRTQPIGLAYVAASLRSRGWDVDILDCRERKKASIEIPPALSYLRDFYPFDDRSPFKLYSGYYHFGMGWKEILQRIKESEADIFGISSSFTPYHSEAMEVARIIKTWDSRKIVVMGGAHVSCDPESVLESPWVDYVVLGEGEVRFPLLLQQVVRGGAGRIHEIDGIGYRRDGEIRITPLQTFIDPLDQLPGPARDLLRAGRYRVKGLSSTMIITSRGCPHACAYCSSHLLMGTAFRTRSPEGILQEMVECRKEYGTGLFDIEDDNFTFDRERARRLMELIIKTFGERNLELTAMNGVSFTSVDGELLKLMRKAGFSTVNLSFVSTDRLTKERVGRPRSPRDFDDILGDVDGADLRAIVYAIFGMPGQRIDEMVDTLIYLMAKKVLIGPSIYYPTPGTPLFKRCELEGLLPSQPCQWRSSAFPIETQEFDRLDSVTLFRLTRVLNFIKGKMDRGELDEGLTWPELRRVLQEKARTRAKGKMHGPVTWMGLLLLLLEEKAFFGLRKDSEGNPAVFRITSSKRVVDCFFEKARQVRFTRSA